YCVQTTTAILTKQKQKMKTIVGTKQMSKNHSKIIQGLIHDAIRFLNSSSSASNKALYLERMYRIEAALDLAVSMTYASKTRDRERGYWQWYNEDIGVLSRSAQKQKTEEAAKEEQKTAERGEWVDFPIDITHQIESLYLRWQADLVCINCPFRRPNELVRFIDPSKPYAEALIVENADDLDDGTKDKKDSEAKKAGVLKDDYSDFGVVTYPVGYHAQRWQTKDMTDEEKRTIFQPYSGDDPHVRVMKVDPLRTVQNMVYHWEWGPLYYRGRHMTAHYTTTEGKAYYQRSIILDRFQKANGVWYRVFHPLPTRKDIDKAQLFPVSHLQLASVGKFFKSYIRGPDNKHYVIDVLAGTVRCVQDQTLFKIRRQVRTASTDTLWREITKQVDTNDNTDVPWKQPEEKAVCNFTKCYLYTYTYIHITYTYVCILH
ncbi:hypothetical protein RFI_07453, partial [Reticulomyxa filosa]